MGPVELSLKFFIITFAVIMAVTFMFIVMIQMGPDVTCPNYGEVPALIDGGYECIPWDGQP